MGDVKIGSNRSFGIVFFIVFLLIALYPLSYSGEIRVWSAIISLIFLVLGLLNSKILTPLNQVWFKFGILLGRFVSPVVMGAIFFAIVTPTAVIMKVLRKNLLNLKKGNKKTYWIEKSKIKSKMKNQF
jgi:predicted membrane protein